MLSELALLCHHGRACLSTVPVGWTCCSVPLTHLMTLQIGHAGDGGLYAELVQDRSFDGLARATGFNNQPGLQHQTVDLAALAARQRSVQEPSAAGRGSFRSKQEYLRSRRQLNARCEPLLGPPGGGIGCHVSINEIMAQTAVWCPNRLRTLTAESPAMS